jgi:hypothetical protein
MIGDLLEDLLCSDPLWINLGGLRRPQRWLLR